MSADDSREQPAQAEGNPVRRKMGKMKPNRFSPPSQP
jgi:hypothetical protein